MSTTSSNQGFEPDSIAGRTGRPHHLPGKLVVSLTSYPPRFTTLALTLRTLLRQTVKADHTILWIAHADLPLLPPDVVALQRSGLEIRSADDIRSYKKIIPALDAFPDAFICTVDDDFDIWPTWLEQLIEGQDLTDRVVSCHRAHEITFDAQGRLNPYSHWIHNTAFRGKSRRLFPTGGLGALYPPGTLAHSAEDRAAALERCPNADDVWLFWMGQKNGVHYRTVGQHRSEFTTWPDSQEISLWAQFNVNGGNDVQMSNMAAKYGYPSPLIHGQ